MKSIEQAGCFRINGPLYSFSVYTELSSGDIDRTDK